MLFFVSSYELSTVFLRRWPVRVVEQEKKLDRSFVRFFSFNLTLQLELPMVNCATSWLTDSIKRAGRTHKQTAPR